MSEKIGIEINLIGADNAKAVLEAIESTTKRLGAKRTLIRMEDGNLVSVEERIKQIQDRLAVLKSQKKMGLISDKETKEMKRLNAELTILQRGLKNATANAKTFGQVFNSISSKVAHIGSAMQSMGNALTRLGNIFRPITTGLLMGAGYKALNLFTEGIGNAFERADTMKNYDRQLKALGLDVTETFKVMGDEAKTAKENLDDAVQGLPTSLDEIMAAQKVYAGATGEMVNSTKTAIAANNAFLASGMGAREQRFMQKYLVALSSGAELTTTQWQSMERIAPLVMRSVAKELGYAGDAYKDFRDDVEHGRIAGEDFLKAFQKVGISGAVADAARAQTESWNGLFSNIRIAVTRLGANVLETLNQTFKDATGRTLLQQLLGWDADGKEVGDGIKHWINDISSSIQDWIKANPEKIIDFFETLKSIDFKGFLKGFAEGMGDIVGWFEKLATATQGADLEKWGKIFAKSGFFGRGLTIVGGLLKGLRHPIAGVGAGGAWLFGKGKGGIFGRLAGLFGKRGEIITAEKTAKTIPSVADTFKSAFSALSGLMQAAGAIIIVTGTGAFALKAVKSMLKDLDEICTLFTEGSWDNIAAVAPGIVVGIGAFTEIFQAIGKTLGPQGLLAVAIAGAASFIVSGSFAADMWAIKQGIIQVKETIGELDEVAQAITDMKGIGTLSASTKNKFQMTVDSINEIIGIFNGKSGSIKDRGEVSQGLGSFSAGSAKSMGRLDEALTSIKSIIKGLNKIASMSIEGDPSKVFDDIKKAVDDMQGIRGPKNIDKHTESLATAMKQIKSMVKSMNKLAETEVNTGGFATFVQNIKTALNDLKSVSGELMLDIEVKLSPLFGSSVEGVKTNIKNAKRAIEDMKTPINISIPVSVTFSVTTNLYAALAKIRRDRQRLASESNGTTVYDSSTNGQGNHQAKGGLIYRAGGGSIPFRRRGTDTVPAMLTPGEYVHNKRAVSAFGIDFMRKVNNLDMRGAMSELMHRAGNMASINRGTHITNNYNNNQRVVQNIHTNSPDFAFRSASRFVGAF